MDNGSSLIQKPPTDRYLKTYVFDPLHRIQFEISAPKLCKYSKNSPPNLSISLANKKMFPYATKNHPWIVDTISVAHLETLERLQALKTKHSGPSQNDLIPQQVRTVLPWVRLRSAKTFSALYQISKLDPLVNFSTGYHHAFHYQ